MQSPKSDSAKIKLLEFIRAERTLLFGAFSSSITKKQKNDVWEKITIKAISLGLAAANRSAAYIRDTYWQNLRKRTIKKIDNSRATGAAGGAEAVFDDIDKLVIDIIGKFLLNYF